MNIIVDVLLKYMIFNYPTSNEWLDKQLTDQYFNLWMVFWDFFVLDQAQDL